MGGDNDLDSVYIQQVIYILESKYLAQMHLLQRVLLPSGFMFVHPWLIQNKSIIKKKFVL